ncbi:MAG: M20/M25/M40 family metallo-hydrolase, partial [Chitinophagales bacterium]
MKKFCFIILFNWILMPVSVAQTKEVLAVRKFAKQHADNIIGEFVKFLAIPNVAGDTPNIQRNAAFIMDIMKKRGIEKVQLLHATTEAVPPAVYGEVHVPGARKTIIFYAHYDAQPVNPAQWAKGLEPFGPKLFSGDIEKNGKNIPFPADNNFNPDWRIYCRSASDDKAGLLAILNAFDAINQSGMHPGSNLKFFFEGEEEAGSPHLHEIMQQHRSLLQSDLWIICDGPVHQSAKKQVVFGVRGDAHL